MKPLTIKQLIEAGVHFGHKTSKWNPKMRPFIYGEKNGIHIIDLTQTAIALENACSFLKGAATRRMNIVFVGTKRAAAEIIEQEARRCRVHFINRRWLGGMLTNYTTLRLRIKRLNELEQMFESGEAFRRPKKEQSVLLRERLKLEKYVGGLKNLRALPDVLFIIDPQKESLALREGVKLGLKIVSLVDTNGNPDDIDYVIAGNDDSMRSLQLIIGRIADAICAGRDDGGTGSSSPDVPKMPLPFGGHFQPAIEIQAALEGEEK